MSKIKIDVNADLSIIKSQLCKDEKFSQGICLHAVYQIALGMDAKDLEALYSSSRKSIYNWIYRYNSESMTVFEDEASLSSTATVSCC